ncbi:unnamed protein product [Rotaria socialis]
MPLVIKTNTIRTLQLHHILLSQGTFVLFLSVCVYLSLVLCTFSLSSSNKCDFYHATKIFLIKRDYLYLKKLQNTNK